MTRRRKSSSRRRPSRGSKKQPSLWEKLKGWRPTWRPKLSLELGPAQRQILGLGLLLLVIVTLLGLLGISSGAALVWWAKAMRRMFGWVALPVTLSVGLFGLRLVWRDLRARIPISPANLVGLELLLLELAVASHAPLVLRLGPDEAFLAADQGRGGGYVGWALAVLLIEGLGLFVGSLVLLAVLLGALYLLLPVSWADLQDWGRHQARMVEASLSRWWIRRQGTPVAPEPAEMPWWEQEPPPAEAKPRKTTTKKPQQRKKARPRPTAGGLPPLDLLDPASPNAYGDTDVRRKTQIIEETLESFGVPARVVEVNQGPTVTQFGLDPGYVERRSAGGQVHQQRVRVGRIASLVDDLALALAAAPIRIEAPVPGRSVVGLEVPNDQISLVSLRGVMESERFASIDSRLAIALGEDVSGSPVAVDLSLMPHLLIAGATGSGKSVCINAIICCLLCNNTPDDLRVLMVDPKMVELIGYNDTPHLLTPVVVDVEQVVGALAWITRQMDGRYKLFHQNGVRNLEEYNRRMLRRKGEDPLPTLVVFIDELADLMMVAPDEVERHICRVAQMGRATGIHLVIATQRPSVDVVTGLIKANFPARISFAVTSQVDSRVILDQGGAESLLGRGDMLFMSPQQAAPVRLQGCFVSDKEIDRLTGYWRTQELDGEQAALFPPWTAFDPEDEEDDLLQEAIELAEGRDRISTSFVQRRLRIGFPRAARLMDQLEEQGIVGPDEGGGRGRQVLLGLEIDLEEIEERLPGVEPD
jgi:S-DNA-T family DNA segregation ATPase FtsK/SpoIIIE